MKYYDYIERREGTDSPALRAKISEWSLEARLQNPWPETIQTDLERAAIFIAADSFYDWGVTSEAQLTLPDAQYIYLMRRVFDVLAKLIVHGVQPGRIKDPENVNLREIVYFFERLSNWKATHEQLAMLSRIVVGGSKRLKEKEVTDAIREVFEHLAVGEKIKVSELTEVLSFKYGAEISERTVTRRLESADWAKKDKGKQGWYRTR